MKEFKKELRDLINTHGIDNGCNMPDFLLVNMMTDIIKNLIDFKIEYHNDCKYDTQTLCKH